MRQPSDGTLDELPDLGALDWTAVRSLIAANEETTRALESYLLRTQYREDGSDLASVRAHIRGAIQRHERAVEELQLALAAVEKRERTDADDPR
jgi:hypothetical protein